MIHAHLFKLETARKTVLERLILLAARIFLYKCRVNVLISALEPRVETA
jgi:hypothetical protein